MRQLNYQPIPLKAAASTTSAAISALNLFYASVQSISTGTVVGVTKLQASNDDPQDGSAPVNWSDIPSATIPVTTGGGAFLIPKTDLCYQWVRVVFTFTSGTGNITVNLKVLGA